MNENKNITNLTFNLILFLILGITLIGCVPADHNNPRYTQQAYFNQQSRQAQQDQQAQQAYYAQQAYLARQAQLYHIPYIKIIPQEL